MFPIYPRKSVSCAVRSYYTVMKNKTFDDKDFKTVCKMASSAFDSLSELHDSGICLPKKRVPPVADVKGLHQKSGNPSSVTLSILDAV